MVPVGRPRISDSNSRYERPSDRNNTLALLSDSAPFHEFYSFSNDTEMQVFRPILNLAELNGIRRGGSIVEISIEYEDSTGYFHTTQGRLRDLFDGYDPEIEDGSFVVWADTETQIIFDPPICQCKSDDEQSSRFEKMVIRKGSGTDGSYFWGCVNFPNGCNETVQPWKGRTRARKVDPDA
ncbi:MAG: hypothetical protein ABEK50_18220 [bacterium]